MTPPTQNTQTLYSELNTRIVRLEDWKASQDVTNAVAMEHRKQVVDRFDQLEQRLEKIDGNTTWLVRLVVGAIILAVIGFFITGTITKTVPLSVPQEYRTGAK